MTNIPGAAAQPADGGTLHPILDRLCGGTAWLVLHPLRVPPIITPRMQGLPCRAFRLERGDLGLAAWHIPCEGSRAGIVLCHGHNSSRIQFASLVAPLHRAGFHVLLFDHRSMGVTRGGVCTYGYREHADVLAAVKWLRENAGVEQVGLMGVSMGGASALLAAARDPDILAVVSEASFARLEDMVEQKFFYLPESLRVLIGGSVRRWAEHWGGVDVRDVDPEAALKGWRRRPLLVIHGGADLLVPPEHGRRLARAAGDGAELWIVRGAPHAHCSTRAGKAYRDRVIAFFRHHVSGG